MCDAVSIAVDDQISVKVEASSWAWMVCGERLIIWKVSQTSVAKVRKRHSCLELNLLPNFAVQALCSLSLQLSVCKDLQLPSSEFAYSADLISITSSGPLESAPTQVSACVSEHYHQWRFPMQT